MRISDWSSDVCSSDLDAERMTTRTEDTFPRQSARTQRFSLGAPRNVTVSPDGARVAFLRSAGPEDPVTSLWVLAVDGPARSEERRVGKERVSQCRSRWTQTP